MVHGNVTAAMDNMQQCMLGKEHSFDIQFAKQMEPNH